MAGDKSSQSRFPMVVRSGSVTVTIYRLTRAFRKNGETTMRTVYSVAYSTPAGRTVRQFGKLSSAKQQARIAADRLAAGETEAATLSQADRNQLIQARKIVGEFPLLAALEEWTSARNLVGTEVIAACTAWAQRRTKLESITVAKAIERFTVAKNGEGVVMTNSYEHVLRRLGVDYGTRQLDSIHARELRAWLGKIKHPVTRNTYRKRIVTLWRWARDEEYLPRDAKTEAEMTKAAQEPPPERSLLDASNLQDLLDNLNFADRLSEVAAVSISAFCGLRSFEAHHQVWEDIHLDEKYLKVTKAKMGTPAYRMVPIPTCCIVWLEQIPPEERKGRIHTFKTDVMTIVRRFALAQNPAISLPDNCLRKTWISASLAITNDLARVAGDAGHSVQTEVRYYRGLVTKKQADAWFKVVPNYTSYNPTDFDKTLVYPTADERAHMLAAYQAMVPGREYSVNEVLDAMDFRLKRSGKSAQ